MNVLRKASQSVEHFSYAPGEHDNVAYSLFASLWVNDALSYAHTSNTSFGLFTSYR